MKSEDRNLHTVFDELLNRKDKEKLLSQRGIVIWLTGLSGSGKTTIANHLERRLNSEGIITKLLDGDNIRTGVGNNLGFSTEDRAENIRRIAEVAKLFMNTGIVTICSFISPTKEIRAKARAIIGTADFHEVFINTPLEICEKRDVKGLYQKARAGEITNFTGIGAPYENPDNDYIEIVTNNKTIDDSVTSLYQQIIKKIKWS
ncbi:MAG: adenylyl-sulfate kinase [Crocinitomicaceae bacterium]|nr:adenylyl-sulfate kinase [Crocinitomicaceae bacterium]MBT6513201.1 adenylyl-sulfate kinase [Crocinitomicaceae bacterium]